MFLLLSRQATEAAFYFLDIVVHYFNMWRYLIPLILASAALSAFVPPLVTVLAILAVIGVVFLARNLEFGLIILVFFFPYLGLVIDFGAFRAFREVYYLRNINAPFIDLYGLVLLGAWILKVIFSTRGGSASGGKYLSIKTWKELPHVKSYLLFWLSGLGSLLMVSSQFLGSSVKYFLRPFSFFYPIFFAVPVSILSRVRLLERVLMVFYATGLLAAFNGLLGLLFGAPGEFPRAQPFGFWGVNPLGPNHNLLAETLIATAPAGLIVSRYQYLSSSKFLTYGALFQWVIALLTFARTAWIAVGLQALIYFWCTYRGRFREIRPRMKWGLVVLVVPLVILGLTTLTETVRGSTLSRLDQMRISVFYFLRSPWLGQGLGTFIPTLWQTRAFLLEYGDPLEAHGIALKLAFEQGLAGLITFAIFAGAIVVAIYKSYRVDQTYKAYHIAALMIVAGSLTYQLFNTTYYSSKLWVPLAVAVAISRLYARSHNHSTLVS